MTRWLRTLAGVLVLVAFPTVLLVLFVALVVAQVLLLLDSVGNGLKWAIILVPAALVLFRGLRVLLAPVREPRKGVRLTDEQHPDLWYLVRQLAVAARTRPPEEIRLTGEGGAHVVEDTRWLGLVSSHRVLHLGAPVVAVLRADQLAAVLTHELAHYGNWDTRLAALAWRGRRAFVNTVSALDRTELLQRLISWLLRGWLALYLRVSGGISRRQEWAADAAAARAVGAETTASALREIRVVFSSWRRFAHHHLVMGWDAGYLPADIFGGYASFRESTVEQVGDEVVSPADTHPPMSARVTAIEAMATTPTIHIGQSGAVELLGDPAVLDAAVVEGMAQKRRADWVTLAQLHGEPPAIAAATAQLDVAARLTGNAATLRTLLDALDAGQLAELAGIPLKQGIGPRGRREQARPTVRDGLLAAVGLALVRAGAATWVPDWPNCARLAADDPHDAALPGLIDAAVADRPDTAGLRTLLDKTNVDLDRPWGAL